MILVVERKSQNNIEHNGVHRTRIAGAGTHMIKIVTIEREYGSGGGEIAQLLATQLGLEALGSVADRGNRAASALPQGGRRGS